MIARVDHPEYLVGFLQTIFVPHSYQQTGNELASNGKERSTLQQAGEMGHVRQDIDSQHVVSGKQFSGMLVRMEYQYLLFSIFRTMVDTADTKIPTLMFE